MRNQGNQRVYVKVYLTDEFGAPVTDATVTYNITIINQSGTLANRGGGYYGGTATATGNCTSFGNNCLQTTSFTGSPTVTVTATRGACAITKSMNVPYP